MSLFDGLVDWWGLGDYAGNGSQLRDFGPGAHHGTWSTYAGLTQVKVPGIGADLGTACVADDDHAFDTEGYNAGGGHGGGSVGYPAGSPWYAASSFSFAIWALSTISDPACPGVVTNFQVQAWGTGTYHTGDRVRNSGKIWKAGGTFFSDGTHPPGDGFNPWTEDLQWESCYGVFLPYLFAGLAGDHVGFPFNTGWMIYADGRADITDPFTASWIMRLVSESNGSHPTLSLSLGTVPFLTWSQYVITSDGVTVDTYQDGAQVDSGDATRLALSGAGIGFAWVDRNLALSGQNEVWQGTIDEGMLWNRKLTGAEVAELHGGAWCNPQYHLATHHRAAPGSGNASASKVASARHLSGVRFRAEPGSSSAGADKTVFTQKAHLSQIRFRSKV